MVRPGRMGYNIKIIEEMMNVTRSTTEIGQGLVEYAYLIAFIALVVIIILNQVGPAVGNVFSGLIDDLHAITS
jgi:Flp pilus assembly pilin Flp